MYLCTVIPYWDFLGITLNFWMSLERIDIMLSYPVHEQSVAFHLFRSSFTSFISVSQFSVCKSCTSFVTFILNIFHFLCVVLFSFLILRVSLKNSLCLRALCISFFCVQSVFIVHTSAVVFFLSISGNFTISG